MKSVQFISVVLFVFAVLGPDLVSIFVHFLYFVPIDASTDCKNQGHKLRCYVGMGVG
jgi:hypothetical protein